MFQEINTALFLRHSELQCCVPWRVCLDPWVDKIITPCGIYTTSSTFRVSYSYRITSISALMDLSTEFLWVETKGNKSRKFSATIRGMQMPGVVDKADFWIFPSSVASAAPGISAAPIDFTGRFNYGSSRWVSTVKSVAQRGHQAGQLNMVAEHGHFSPLHLRKQEFTQPRARAWGLSGYKSRCQVS